MDVTRKKWSRAKVPRVKTGCITCKIRHLKCDESKPKCQRCSVDEHKCDGYPEPRPVRPAAKSSISAKSGFRFVQFNPDIERTRSRTSRPSLDLLRQNPSSTVGVAADAPLFYHVVNFTIKELDMASDGQAFWHDTVLPLAHSVEPVMHALCAMGGAHRRFLFNYDTGRDKEIASQSNLAAIQKYNQAIGHIMPFMSKQTPENLRITIICCIIFICIENLHGRFVDSVRHLHAACHLLASLHLEHKVICTQDAIYKASQGPDTGATPRARDEHNLLTIVTDMVHKLGRKVAMYLGDDMFFIPDLPSETVEPGDPQVPFSSFSEADELLQNIDRAYSDFAFAPDGAGEWSHSGHFHNRRGDSNVPSSIPNPGARRTVLHTTKSSLEVWNRRYELLQRRELENSNPPSQGQMRQGAALSLNQAFWLSVLKLQTTGPQLQQEDCEVILNRAQALVDTEAAVSGQPHPVFAFDGDLIPSLYVVCCFCPDINILRRAVSMLRLLRRREGIWDSDEVAGICRGILSAREGHTSGTQLRQMTFAHDWSHLSIPGIANPPFYTLC